jgi:UDP-N-acetylglucosamine:LPS N-acetylglucosamine transferase
MGMKAIDLFFFDAGGGHRSAANALRQAIEQQGRAWDVRLVNLQEVLASLDVFRKITGIRSEDVYNLVLRKGWTLGSPYMVPLMHALIRSYHGKQVALLRKHFEASRPDLVVSVIPNFNRSLFDGLNGAAPMVTILTDMADYPPHFWMEKQDQYFICGTARAAEQARMSGHAADRVFRSSGMILNPRFYEPVQLDRKAERQRLGLDPDLPTALVLFGGHGSGAMKEIAGTLGRSGLQMQLILICGHNGKLAESLRAMRGPMRMHVEGFTREIPRFMHISDFFIGKPGPGSISEALAMKLPVIVESNAWTMPQERYNAEWVRERGVGLVLRSFREIVPAVETLLEGNRYAQFRRAVSEQNNRAVFEIPDMLGEIMQTA